MTPNTKNILSDYPDINLPPQLHVVRFPDPIIAQTFDTRAEPIMFLHPLHGTFDCEKAILKTLSHFQNLQPLSICLIKNPRFQKGNCEREYTIWIEENFRYHMNNGVLCPLLPDRQMGVKLDNGSRGYARSTEAEVTRIFDKLSSNHESRKIKATLMLQDKYEGRQYIEDLIQYHCPSFHYSRGLQDTIRYALGLSLDNHSHKSIKGVVIPEEEDIPVVI